VLEVEPHIIEDYVRTGKLKIVYRHLLQLGAGSELLAEASECAADQQKFWAMREEIYRRLDQFYSDTRAAVERTATAIGLDTGQFSSCLDNATHRAMVQADFAAAEAEGVRSRPVFKIGDQLIVGSRPLDFFQRAIDSALGS
jgi:protein-disulfide isomerase